MREQHTLDTAVRSLAHLATEALHHNSASADSLERLEQCLKAIEDTQETQARSLDAMAEQQAKTREQLDALQTMLAPKYDPHWINSRMALLKAVTALLMALAAAIGGGYVVPWFDPRQVAPPPKIERSP